MWRALCICGALGGPRALDSVRKHVAVVVRRAKRAYD